MQVIVTQLYQDANLQPNVNIDSALVINTPSLNDTSSTFDAMTAIPSISMPSNLNDVEITPAELEEVQDETSASIEIQNPQHMVTRS